MASQSHPKLISYRTGGIAQHWHTAMFSPSTTSHANYSSICSPSPRRAFAPLLPRRLASVLVSSARRQTARLPVDGAGLRRPRGAFNLSLISLHCNGKWFCVLLFDWSCKPAFLTATGFWVFKEWEVFSILPMLKMCFIKEFISVMWFYILTRQFVSDLMGKWQRLETGR